MKSICDLEPHDIVEICPAGALEYDRLYRTFGVVTIENEMRRDVRCAKVVRNGYRVGVVGDGDVVRREDLETRIVRNHVARKPTSVEIQYVGAAVIAALRWRGVRKVIQQRGVGPVLGRQGSPVSGNDGADVREIGIREGLGEVGRRGRGDH